MREYRKYFIGAGVSLVFAAFFKFALLGYGFIAYTLTAVAAVFLFYAGLRWCMGKNEALTKKVYRVILTAALAGLMAFAVTEAMIIGESKSTNNEDADYAVVLGAGVNGTVPSRALYARLEATLRYHEENPDTVIIVSGGQGPGEDITEAECMYRWLTERGVPDRLIVKEEKATSTEENLQFSREIILKNDPDFSGKVCVVTECYHLMRAKLIAQDAGFERVVAQSGYSGFPILTVNYYIREVFAVWYYMITR